MITSSHLDILDMSMKILFHQKLLKRHMTEKQYDYQFYVVTHKQFESNSFYILVKENQKISTRYVDF